MTGGGIAEVSAGSARHGAPAHEAEADGVDAGSDDTGSEPVQQLRTNTMMMLGTKARIRAAAPIIAMPSAAKPRLPDVASASAPPGI